MSHEGRDWLTLNLCLRFDVFTPLREESQYDSMQLVFRRRPVGGLGFSYTLPYNQRTDGAPWDESVIDKFAADNDVRHRVVLSVTYEMPFRGTGAAGALMSDWQVNGIAYWQSGRPFNVASKDSDRYNIAGFTGQRVGNSNPREIRCASS